jgi:hypothetical protein
MERDTESTVYAPELKGIFLALQIIEATPELNDRKAIVFTDNQSALRTMRKPSNTSGQYILRGFSYSLMKKMLEASTQNSDGPQYTEGYQVTKSRHCGERGSRVDTKDHLDDAREPE